MLMKQLFMQLSKEVNSMKKVYEKAEIKISFFDNEEVLAASAVYAPEAVDPDDLPIMPAN